jgi:hypothetical protein
VGGFQPHIRLRNTPHRFSNSAEPDDLLCFSEDPPPFHEFPS